MITRLPVLLATAALILPLQVPPAQATSPSYTCQGQAATIVGGKDGMAIGTRRDDVIVVPRAYLMSVYAGAGDDLVCIVDGPRGATPSGDGAIENGIELEEGDDTLLIESTQVGTGISIEPGPGADTVLGGPEDEFVNFFGAMEDDLEADIYRMGAGDDQVTSGSPKHRNLDEVDLGPGSDWLSLAGPLDATGSLAGGAGADVLMLQSSFDSDGTVGHLIIDNRVGQANLDGVLWMTWTSFEDFLVLSDDHNITFIGSDRAERVDLGETAISVDLGGGDDAFYADGSYRNGIVLEGGEGRDLIRATGHDVRLDVGRSLEVRAAEGAPISQATVHGFEDATIKAVNEAWLRGTKAAQDLRAAGLAKVEVRGRGGADTITLGGIWGINARVPMRKAWGGGGDDFLTGSAGDDLLVGGPGHDIAVGMDGVDHCDAEVPLDCESE